MAPFTWILPPAPQFAGGKYPEAAHNTQRQAILKAVQQANGNVTDAARLLGVHPNYPRRLIRNFESAF